MAPTDDAMHLVVPGDCWHLVSPLGTEIHVRQGDTTTLLGWVYSAEQDDAPWGPVNVCIRRGAP